MDSNVLHPALHQTVDFLMRSDVVDHGRLLNMLSRLGNDIARANAVNTQLHADTALLAIDPKLDVLKAELQQTPASLMQGVIAADHHPLIQRAKQFISDEEKYFAHKDDGYEERHALNDDDSSCDERQRGSDEDNVLDDIDISIFQSFDEWVTEAAACALVGSALMIVVQGSRLLAGVSGERIVVLVPCDGDWGACHRAFVIGVHRHGEVRICELSQQPTARSSIVLDIQVQRQERGGVLFMSSLVSDGRRYRGAGFVLGQRHEALPERVVLFA